MSQNKPKILYIVTQGHWGGAQKYVHDLADSLAGDFDISVAVGEPDNNPDLQRKLKEKGIKHFQLKHLRRAISPIHDILAILELHKLYKKLKPDIVHLNSTKASILGSLIMQNAKCKMQNAIVYTVHGWVFDEPMPNWKKKLYKLLEKWTAKRKNKIIVLSEKDKNTATKELKIPEKKLKIIPVGIELHGNILSKNEAIKKLGSMTKENNSFVIGTIANFYPTKNLDNLIKAAAKIKDKLNNFHLILIGDGPERTKLKNLIEKYNLEKNVHMPGFLENAEQYLPAFDLFVLPSKKEGLPYTILEAKMNHIPVISTDVGGISTIIENKKTGLLVPPENVEKLAEAILYAYQNKNEMNKMAEAGHCENFQPYLKQNMIEKTTSLLQQLLP